MFRLEQKGLGTEAGRKTIYFSSDYNDQGKAKVD